jgi:hypothetical protein
MKRNLWIYLALAMLLAAPMTVIGCGGGDDDDSLIRQTYLLPAADPIEGLGADSVFALARHCGRVLCTFII